MRAGIEGDVRPSFVIRSMRPDEVDLAVDWAADEGWNPGLHDAQAFSLVDPDGFLIGLLDNEPVATISAVRYGAGFGFLGFYIVVPGHRGEGLGLELWNAALDRLGRRTIGLDGVVAQQENYRRSGFVLAHRNVRYQGVGHVDAPAASGIVALSTLPFEIIRGFDAPFFPDDRARFLRNWIEQPGAYSLGATEGGRLVGYGVARSCRAGYKVGPLLADSHSVADRLFMALRSRVPVGDPVFLDAPAANPAAIALAERHDLHAVFETARMYRGVAPDLPLDRWFGVTSFELG